MATKPRQLDRDFAANGGATELADALNLRYGHLPAEEIIAVAIDLFEGAGGISATSSFGADSAALLHLIAEAEPGLPITFLDTGQHFGETLQYRDQLAADLGLTNIVIVKPLDDALNADDPDGILHRSDTERCCAIRKVEPMARAVAPYRAWFTGRKRGQASTRAEMPVFEAVGPRIRVNPLARWTTEDQADYMRRHDLRQNPLVAFGYLSIGCFPCTSPVKPGEDARSGRWVGQAKTECGIHLPGLEAALPSASG
ncbi:phosphoadenylyl-sulfate reductase [Nitratireductor sp. GISD-1A_MAKvit]|uniref:phosphoadenylyl-sulfate reductase n=1 Tax=Nitratireductor sp. GISD-1A_MAKvit TaxID=3234198 RepID=UPI0034657F56